MDKFFKKKPVRSLLATIKLKDVLLGVLKLVNLENNVYFSEEDCFLLEIVVNFSAVPLISASLFENLVPLSYYDPLTGAYNPTKLEELLRKPSLFIPKRKSAFSYST